MNKEKTVGSILDEFSSWSKEDMDRLAREWKRNKNNFDEEPSLEQLAEYLLGLRNLI